MKMTWKAAKKMMRDLDRDAMLERIGLEQRRSHTGDLFGGMGLFAIGILVGAGLGLMFAPRRGDEMRAMMTDAWKNRRMDELRDLGTEAAQPSHGM
jgi:hypothetical protein